MPKDKKESRCFIYLDSDVKKDFDNVKAIVGEQLGFKLSHNKLVAHLIKRFLEEK